MNLTGCVAVPILASVGLEIDKFERTVDASQGEPKSDAEDGDGKKHRWWREMIAGFVAVGVSCYDIWIIGKDKGLSGPLDELVLLTGIALIAGVKNLFGAKTNGKR